MPDAHAFICVALGVTNALPQVCGEQARLEAKGGLCPAHRVIMAAAPTLRGTIIKNDFVLRETLGVGAFGKYVILASLILPHITSVAPRRFFGSASQSSGSLDQLGRRVKRAEHVTKFPKFLFFPTPVHGFCHTQKRRQPASRQLSRCSGMQERGNVFRGI